MYEIVKIIEHAAEKNMGTAKKQKQPTKTTIPDWKNDAEPLEKTPTSGTQYGSQPVDRSIATCTTS